MTKLMRRNAGFLMELQRENAENGRMMMGQLFQELNGFRRGGDSRERQFREISCITREESQWKECSLKFQAAVKEANMENARVQFGDVVCYTRIWCRIA